ncbi:MAG: XdhC family protein [Microbacteriaceae bacterium]
MLEIAGRVLRVLDAGGRVAVATAVAIEGSAPRTIGTSMALAVDADGGLEVIGTIAGGCVESAAVAACEEVLAGAPDRTERYGYSDADALTIGLSCGGTITVHVRAVDAALEAELRSGGPIEVCAGFVERPRRRPRMIVLGSMDFASALSAAASVAGFRVTAVDPRPLFLTAARFPDVERVVAWPPEYLRTAAIDTDTSICVLSHDWRFDAEALELALRSPAGYVGAMGSRTTHARRVASLAERGVTDAELARLRSPIGLDIGASTPEQTAISILAEVIAARSGRAAVPLAATSGAIHPGAPGLAHAQSEPARPEPAPSEAVHA